MSTDKMAGRSPSVGSPFAKIFPLPIISKRDPKTSDKCAKGQAFINTTNSTHWVLNKVVSNAADWKQLAFNGDAIVTDAISAADLVVAADSITLNAAGKLVIEPATGTAAAAAVTINAQVGVAVLTGQTTAAAASVIFTVINSTCLEGYGVIASVSTQGSNDGQLTINRIKTQAGSFQVQCTNEGAAAVSGDIVIAFQILVA